MKYTPFQKLVTNEIERIKAVMPLQEQSATLPYHLVLPSNRYTITILSAYVRRNIFSRLFN